MKLGPFKESWSTNQAEKNKHMQGADPQKNQRETQN